MTKSQAIETILYDLHKRGRKRARERDGERERKTENERETRRERERERERGGKVGEAWRRREREETSFTHSFTLFKSCFHEISFFQAAHPFNNRLLSAWVA